MLGLWQGACSAEVAAARVATALGILSYPAVINELLRLTTFIRERGDQRGRLGQPSLPKPMRVFLN